jgi:hypothetical protein
MSGLKTRLAGIAALFFSPLAFAAPPPVPTVTVGAGLKQLRFDVEPVNGASFYRLWFRANGGATWVKYFETTNPDPVFTVSISAHLLDWWNARYKVSACNSSGCGTTADIYVTEHMRDSVGYFKPRPGALEPTLYGQDPALSADGKTFAVVSGETFGPRKNSIAVTVYRKGANGWSQEARLVPSLVEADTGRWEYGRRVAINGDGTVIALGVPIEFALFPGHAYQSGAVYLFRRSGSTWSQEQKLTLDGRRPYQYGKIVDLDDSGQTLAVWRYYDTADPNDGRGAGTIELFRRGSSGWTLQATIPVTDELPQCNGFALSGDGRVIARTCGRLQIYEAPDWTLRQTIETNSRAWAVDVNYDGSLIVTPTDPTTPPPSGATWTPRMMVVRRNGATWEVDPAFTHVGKARNVPPGTVSHGDFVAISRDGRFVAVADPNNIADGTGVVRGPFTGTSEYTGAVFVYERKFDAWRLRNMIKPNVLTPGMAFGYGLALGDDGKILAVGSLFEDSAARGIDGDQTDTSAPDSGAAWLY